MNNLFDLSEFEISVLKCFAKYHSFSMAEIEQLYMQVKSFDKVLLVMDIALKYNLSIFHLAKEL